MYVYRYLKFHSAHVHASQEHSRTVACDGILDREYFGVTKVTVHGKMFNEF